MSEDSGKGGPNDAGTKGKKGLLGSILQNARATSVRYDATRPQSETLLCKGCGAARPDDASLEVCDYCGNRFF